MQALDQYLPVDGIRLRYRDEGQGAAVVFIHGWTLDLDTWDPQSAELGRSMRVVRWDRRGFGLSRGSPALVRDVSDLHALLDHLQIARATLVGMSQGARVAVAFALGFPERVASLVLDGPPNFASDFESGADEDLPLGHYRELVRASGVESFRRLWQDHPFMQLRTQDPQARELLQRVLARYQGLDLRDPSSASNVTIDLRSLAAARLPVLIVNGEFDSASRRRAGDELGRALPLAVRALVADAGHLANLDNPRAYNEIIRAFLERQFPSQEPQ
jgi:pimeloyl-ACP methyl ester carboxylesterase